MENYFIVVEAWMVQELKLSGNELLIFAAIYGFSKSKNGIYFGRATYLADILGISEKTIKRLIKSLEEKGLIKEETGVVHGTYLQRGVYYMVTDKVVTLVDKMSVEVDKMSAELDKMSSQGGQNVQPYYIEKDKEKYIDIDIDTTAVETPTPKPKKRSVKSEKESADQPNGFSRFWEVYPKRVARKEAEKAFNKLNPDDELLERMLGAVKRQAKSKQWCEDGGRYIPNAATWINGKRWEDELTEATDVSKDHIKGSNYDMDAIERDAKEIVEFSL